MMEDPRESRGSSAARILEHAYHLIRIAEPCLPRAVIIVLPAGIRKKLGHFHGSSWLAEHSDVREHEIALHPATFSQPEEVLNTLLHEAAHALLFEWGLNGGCGADGRYHRDEFHGVCKKLGLQCRFTDRSHGWDDTHWPDTGVPVRWAPVLELLRTLPLGTPVTQVRRAR